MAKTDDLNETWTIDSPLEEITMEMVNDPPSENVVHDPVKTSEAGTGKNGGSKSHRANSRKKKSIRRRNT